MLKAVPGWDRKTTSTNYAKRGTLHGNWPNGYKHHGQTKAADHESTAKQNCKQTDRHHYTKWTKKGMEPNNPKDNGRNRNKWTWLNEPKRETTNLINNKTEDYFKEKTDKEGNGKSKVKHLLEGIQTWKAGNRQEYMEKLNRKQASLIFQARTRMLSIKDNFWQRYINDLVCRACGQQLETQTHVLNECETILKYLNSRVQQAEIFTKDAQKLKLTANKIAKIMLLLQDASQQSGAHQSQQSGLSGMETQEHAPDR
jgi:hypothetical protein